MADLFADVKVGDMVCAVSPLGRTLHRVSKVMVSRLSIEGSIAHFRKSNGQPIRANYLRKIALMPPELKGTENG